METGGDIRQPGGRSDSDTVGASAAGAPDEQSVRVVTVAFNPGEELERFLASLAAATARRLVVVIADNGTEHDVVTAAAQRHGARVVGDGTNLGYGAGANLAAADLEEDWIVVANPDLVWKPGSLDALIDAGLANPAAGCLGPLLLNPDGTVYPSGGGETHRGEGGRALRARPALPGQGCRARRSGQDLAGQPLLRRLSHCRTGGLRRDPDSGLALRCLPAAARRRLETPEGLR